jgi:hypothetical protein
LTPEERTTCFNLVWPRIPIVRWSTFDYVADVDLTALPTHCCDDTVEQFAGSTDKGPSLPVFLQPRALANQNYRSRWASFAKNDMGPVAVETTTVAFSEVGTNLI